jgi:hypothetical protein
VNLLCQQKSFIKLKQNTPRKAGGIALNVKNVTMLTAKDIEIRLNLKIQNYITID